jgi:predicted nucleotidyltransferase
MATDTDQRLSTGSGLTQAEIAQLAAVLKHYPQVEQAVLFGSRAKGTARANSDVDLALYGVLDDRTVAHIALEMDELPLPYLFDIKAFENLRNPALVEHIRRVGLPVYP